jgi:hypothetical protein
MDPTGLQYFIPNATPAELVEDGKLRRDALERYNLAERLADVVTENVHFTLANVNGSVGPGKQEGIIIAPVSRHRGSPDPLGNWPLRQVCMAIPKQVCAPEAVILANKDALPDPLALERHAIIPGYTIDDRFGRSWHVPVARSPRGKATLPRLYSFDRSGQCLERVADDFAWLWNLAGELRDWFTTDDSRPRSWVIESVVKILAVNYRLGKEELGLLDELGAGFLDDRFVDGVCFATVDFALVDEAKKNMTASGDAGATSSSSSKPGDADGSPSIPQAGAG